MQDAQKIVELQSQLIKLRSDYECLKFRIENLEKNEQFISAVAHKACEEALFELRRPVPKKPGLMQKVRRLAGF